MNRITIDNFRCFPHLEMEFRKKVNLLIGDNAAGKTSLLKACKYALSAWFSGFSDENTRLQTFNEADFRNVELQGFMAQEEPIRIKFCLNADHFFKYATNDGLYSRLSSEQYIGRNSKKNSRFIQRGVAYLKKYGDFVKKHYIFTNGNEMSQVIALPLLVSFSTEDIHTKRKIRENSYSKYSQKPSFGYYECLNANGLFKYWRNRMLVLQEAFEGESKELQVVCDAIVKALGQDGCNIIRKVHVRPMKKDVFYEFTDGRKVASSQLSDGYRRLVNIVTDIAFRCYLLNGALYGVDTANKTKGTVLIDEIDMHLHPTLQANIAKALSDTFPNLQFIITSHAPMVMSSVKTDEENAVFKLEYNQEAGYTLQMVNTYGQDVSTISRRDLGIAPRVADIQEKIDALNQLIDDERVDEARAKLEELKAEFADTLPELISAEANLRFLSDDLD